MMKGSAGPPPEGPKSEGWARREPPGAPTGPGEAQLQEATCGHLPVGGAKGVECTVILSSVYYITGPVVIVSVWERSFQSINPPADVFGGGKEKKKKSQKTSSSD